VQDGTIKSSMHTGGGVFFVKSNIKSVTVVCLLHLYVVITTIILIIVIIIILGTSHGKYCSLKHEA
jgi:hypothetical protein